MDDQQLNQNTGQPDPADGQDNILPPLQAPPQFSPSADGSDVPMSVNQTIPDDRSLVPMPEEAADSDLIEKEWVLKAKQIVEHTTTDPFAQQEQLSSIKAEYLKKRYNKDLA